MAFNMILWENCDGRLVELPKGRLDTEERLENWIARDVSLLGLDVLLIGRQVRTPSGGRIDLFGIDQQGDLVILELKRDRTPREVVAQVLDYGSWVAELLPSQVADIAQNYLGKPLTVAFHESFETELPGVLHNDHRMVIVASELDDSSERIVQYLSARHSLNINVVFFTCFKIPPAKCGSDPHFPLDPVYTPDRTRKWMRVSNQANVRSISSSMLLHRWLRVTASCNRHHTRSIGFVSGAYVGR